MPRGGCDGDSGVKGRPPLEPRIKALEAKLADLEKQTSTLLTICRGLDERIKDLEGRAPQARYESIFDHWPGNNVR